MHFKRCQGLKVDKILPINPTKLAQLNFENIIEMNIPEKSLEYYILNSTYWLKVIHLSFQTNQGL